MDQNKTMKGKEIPYSVSFEMGMIGRSDEITGGRYIGMEMMGGDSYSASKEGYRHMFADPQSKVPDTVRRQMDPAATTKHCYR